MPLVKVTERCIVKPAPNVNVTYDVVDSVLAPDAHIEEIVRQGKGERLTSRGEFFAPSECASATAASGSVTAPVTNPVGFAP